MTLWQWFAYILSLMAFGWMLVQVAAYVPVKDRQGGWQQFPEWHPGDDE